MKKIVVIDNYDSFTYNLVHYLEDLDCEVTIFRNDEFDIDELEHELTSNPDRFATVLADEVGKNLVRSVRALLDR